MLLHSGRSRWAIGICLATLSLLAVSPGAWGDTPAAATYDGGDGSAGDPYQIATLAQLRLLSETPGDWASYFELTADIDAMDTATWNVGDHDGDGGTPDEPMGFSPIGSGPPFAGGFDGNGYAIVGLLANRPIQNAVGFFGELAGSASGLSVLEADVTGNSFVGALSGTTTPTVSNVVSCCATGVASGTDYVGGLVGLAAGPVTECVASVRVNGRNAVGGLVGQLSPSATGGVVTSCYATGSASGDYGVGGLVGVSNVGRMVSCYATGLVSGASAVGGLVGHNMGTAMVELSYWDTETSGTATGVGQNEMGLVQALPATSAQMQLQMFFITFDFASTWAIVEGETRPYLQWQSAALFEGPPTAVTATGFTVSEGYVHNVAGVAIVEYGFLVREDGAATEVAYPVATGQNLTAGNGVALDGAVIDGLELGTTYHYCAYAIDANGLVHVGTERAATTLPYAVGAGTSEDPYELSTLEELRRLSENPDHWESHFVLAADIDASDTASWNVGDHDDDPGTPDEAMGFSPIGEDYATPFAGSFDGDGYVVSGLFINRPAQDYAGLFGYVVGSPSIANLGVVDVDITGYDRVGGLAGAMSESSITSCYASGAVSGTDQVGGLVGMAREWGSHITSCYATTCVNGDGSVGGLVGDNNDCDITSCYATGAVKGSGVVGGLVGDNRGGDITSCYTTGAVSGTFNVGGLIGQFDNNKAGSAKGARDDGGLGVPTKASVSDSYWDTETSGRTAGVGWHGGGTFDATGLTAAEMKQQALVSGFDFAATWAIVEGETRPYLQWQAVAVFEGVPSLEAATGFALDEGYVYNVPGSGSVVTEYGFVAREDGSAVETFCPTATGQSLAEGTGVALDGAQVDGLFEDTTYFYRAYAVDSRGVTHYGTERGTFTTTHRPTSADSAVTTDEGVPYVFSESDFSFSDVDAGDAFDGVRIMALTTEGVLQYNAGSWGAVTQGQEILAADISMGRLRFKPASRENGTPYATFEFQVADSTASYSATSYVMTVNVTSIPDPPIIDQSDPHYLTTEIDVPGTLSLTATEGDGDPLTWSIATPATNGTAEVDDGEVTYTPDPGFLGGDWFVVEVSDVVDGADTITILVTVEAPDDPCDVDGSGAVNAIDVQLVINAALGLTVAYDCDANKDGSVNAIDVQLVINAALGL